MDDRIKQEASEVEKRLAQAMGDRNVPKGEVLGMLQDLPATERFVMRNTWIALARDESLENWRRLESYKLLVYRCLTYPLLLENFIEEATTPMGVSAEEIVDMTMASFVPLERRSGTMILMVNLPIATSIGPASVYLAVCRHANTVERVAVYPDTVDDETRPQMQGSS